MSERDFFSLRYSVPGYVFIFLVLSLNITPLLIFLNSNGSPELFGAFLAFASLLAGSSAGFLVSQFWWFRFQKNGGIFQIKEFKGEIRILEEELKLKLPTDEKEKRRVEEAFLDLTCFLEKEDRVLKMVNRRWDIYHVLSSVIHSLWIGLGSGLVCRVFVEFLLHRTNLFDLSFNAETFFCVAAIVIVIILMVFFDRGRRVVAEGYYPLHEALVRRSLSKNIPELSKAFPSLFPTKKKEI